MTRLALVLCLAVPALAACGGGDSAADAGVSFIDSGPPDADLGSCTADQTRCGADCVDTSSDSAHCGGCDLACDSPAQLCTGALPCACPEGILPAEPTFIFDTVQMQQGAFAAIGAYSDQAVINGLVVSYDGTTPTGQDLTLSVETLIPTLAVAHDVDVGSQTAHGAFQAVSGTLNLTSACDVGAAGTATNVTFVEVTAELPPTVVEGGCEFTVESVAFSIGDPCPLPDAGV